MVAIRAAETRQALCAATDESKHLKAATTATV
jgi:hypothetical protein